MSDSDLSKPAIVPAHQKEVEKQPKPTQSEQYYDEAGDLTLLSSDNILFRIHAYRFQASSSVFRHMMQSSSSGSGECIELSDLQIETAKVITALLDIMIKDTNILDISLITPDDTRLQVLSFALKYDFVNEIRTIKYQLKEALSNWDDKRRTPTDVILIASMLDEHSLCGNAIKKGGQNWHWLAGPERNQEKRFGEVLKGSRPFDLTGAPLDMLKRVPIEIVWALLRASHRPMLSTGAARQAEADAMAEDFTRLMKLPGAPRFA